MEEKPAKPTTEVQLGFAFLTDTAPPIPSRSDTPPSRSIRPGSRAHSLADTLATAQPTLLEAPLKDVDTQLLSLLEFCEAALTRALDVASTRTGKPFSAEEYRSLRGIGQAQWLLTEKINDER